MKAFFAMSLVFVAAGVAVFLLWTPRIVMVSETTPRASELVRNAASGSTALHGEVEVQSRETPSSGTSSSKRVANGNFVSDIEPQKQLPSPPAIVKGLYVTAWVAGVKNRVNSLITLMQAKGLNAAVVDIKDYSGYLSYTADIETAKNAGAEDEIRIREPNALIKTFHDAGIYVIGRITIFQDPVLAKAHPEWALQNKKTGKTWRDKNGLAWLDAGAKPVWEYNVAIARDAFARGFDEVQFDYVRFPSDGDLQVITYPFSDPTLSRSATIASFFGYMRNALPNRKISADIFGLTTIATDDLGIGQRIEAAYRNFDAVSPMVYPSHFANGSFGYANPAAHPYEVIAQSIGEAVRRLRALAPKNRATSTKLAATVSETAVPGTPDSKPLLHVQLRPWLQAFDLGAVYTHAMVEAQIKAVEKQFIGAADLYGGWLLWDPANKYVAL